MEKREPSYSVERNVNWCSYHEEQHGNSFTYLFIGSAGSVLLLRLISSLGEWASHLVPPLVVEHRL